MDLFDLVAKITLDSSEYEREIEKSVEGSSRFSFGWTKAGKVAVAAIGAATVAIGALTKSAVNSYAEYEQLAGGVRKLYGDAADELMNYANEAYKTSGMSANQYMEQATSFSAALINSLNGDQKKAAEQTDVAMRAMSDNVNTFGTDMESVQTAFQSLAKGQFNTLDNLKLGYGGTRAEMERLIADANEYAKTLGMTGDLSIDSFSDIVTAIDLVQQKQGIAGTTAKEAATTIEGSLNMTKAAWENLIAGIANPDADMGKLMDNLVVAIVGENEGEGLLNQIIPAIERALQGVNKLIGEAAPLIASQFPLLMDSVLPSLLNAVSGLVGGVAKALPQLIKVIVSQIPTLVKMLVSAVTSALPQLAAMAPEIIFVLAEGINQSLPELIPAAISMVLEIADAIVSNVDVLIDAAIMLVSGIAKGLIEAIPVLVSKAPTIIKNLANSLIKGAGKLNAVGTSLMGNLLSGIISGISNIIKKVSGYASRIPSAIRNGIGSLYSIGVNLVQGMWNGIKAKWDSMVSWFTEKARNLPSPIKKVLGISSPSKVFAEIGKWIPEGLALGIEKNMGVVRNASDALADATMFVPETGARTYDSSKSIQIINNIDINKAQDPEAFAIDLVRSMKLSMRTL